MHFRFILFLFIPVCFACKTSKFIPPGTVEIDYFGKPLFVDVTEINSQDMLEARYWNQRMEGLNGAYPKLAKWSYLYTGLNPMLNLKKDSSNLIYRWNFHYKVYDYDDSTSTLLSYENITESKLFQVFDSISVDSSTISFMLKYGGGLYEKRDSNLQISSLTGRYYSELVLMDSVVLDSFSKKIAAIIDTLYSNSSGVSLLPLPWQSDFPAIGYSHQQAKDFCSWRSDRVFEMLLDLKKIYRFDVLITQEKGYLRRKHFLSKSIFRELIRKQIKIPNYRLPTKEELVFYSYAQKHPKVNKLGYDTTTRKYRRWNSKNAFLINSYEQNQEQKDSGKWMEINQLIKPVYWGRPNEYGLYNTLGNVAEMTSDDSVTLGGSFMQTMDQIKDGYVIRHSNPSIYTGFRCVCEMLNPEEYLKQQGLNYEDLPDRLE